MNDKVTMASLTIQLPPMSNPVVHQFLKILSCIEEELWKQYIEQTSDHDRAMEEMYEQDLFDSQLDQERENTLEPAQNTDSY